MDDRTGTTHLARAALAVAGFLVLVLTARAVAGDAGVQLVLVATMVAVSVFAYGQLTGRPLPRPVLRSRDAPAQPTVVEDTWRSERWVAEAVERGLRALDEWRFEQREA